MVFCGIPRVKVWLSLVPGSFREPHEDSQQRRDACIKRSMVIMPLLFSTFSASCMSLIFIPASALSLHYISFLICYPIHALALLLCFSIITSCIFQIVYSKLQWCFVRQTSIFLIYQRTHMVTLSSFSVLLLFHSILSVLGIMDNFGLLRQNVFLCVSVTSTLWHNCLNCPSWLFFFSYECVNNLQLLHMIIL